MPAAYNVPLVDTWDALNDRLDQILSEGGHGPATRDAYRSALRWWEAFCQEVGVDPYEAPFDAWEAAVQKGRRKDGRRLGWDYYSLIVRAVAREHHRRGLPPVAPSRRQHAGSWTSIGESYRTMLNSGWVGNRETYDRDPWLRKDVAAILRVAITDLPLKSLAQHAGKSGGVRRVAQRLVLLDTGCSSHLLARTTPEDVSVAPGEITLLVGKDRVTLEHDHAELYRGVPYDCAHCAVAERLAELAPGEPLFSSRAVYEVADGRWPGLLGSTSRLIEVPDLTPRERAGLRGGLVLAAHRPKEWTWWLLGRAWVAVAWEAGFRMSADLARLDRSWCSPLPDDAGFRIQLAGTKDD